MHIYGLQLRIPYTQLAMVIATICIIIHMHMVCSYNLYMHIAIRSYVSSLQIVVPYTYKHKLFFIIINLIQLYIARGPVSNLYTITAYKGNQLYSQYALQLQFKFDLLRNIDNQLSMLFSIVSFGRSACTNFATELASDHVNEKIFFQQEKNCMHWKIYDGLNNE